MQCGFSFSTKAFVSWFVYHFPEIMHMYVKHLPYSQQQQAQSDTTAGPLSQ